MGDIEISGGAPGDVNNEPDALSDVLEETPEVEQSETTEVEDQPEGESEQVETSEAGQAEKPDPVAALLERIEKQISTPATPAKAETPKPEQAEPVDTKWVDEVVKYADTEYGELGTKVIKPMAEKIAQLTQQNEAMAKLVSNIGEYVGGIADERREGVLGEMVKAAGVPDASASAAKKYAIDIFNAITKGGGTLSKDELIVLVKQKYGGAKAAPAKPKPSTRLVQTARPPAAKQGGKSFDEIFDEQFSKLKIG